MRTIIGKAQRLTDDDDALTTRRFKSDSQFEHDLMVKDGGRRRMICQWAVRVNSWCVVVGLMGVDWRVISGGHQWSVGNNWGLMVGQGRLLDERGRVNLMWG